MREFIRENWLYILLPILFVIAGVAAILWFAGGDASGFHYNV